MSRLKVFGLFLIYVNDSFSSKAYTAAPLKQQKEKNRGVATMTGQSGIFFKTRHFFRPRRILQLVFLLITCYIGIRFYGFAHQLEAGLPVTVERPPGVEAFLPISALVSLKYFMVTGVFSRVHPAGLVLFMLICGTALLFRKGFCSWICPIGFLSDILARIHLKLFNKKFRVPVWPDRVLQSLKYLIAGFFIYSIFINMPANALAQFINSPYNRFADLKMLEFFSRISPTALTVLLILLVLSVMVPYFWCRYLCPYGALLGLISFFSAGKISRDSDRCTGCRRCERICPGQIKITGRETVRSLECSACQRCVDACPEKEVLRFTFFRRFSISPGMMGAIMAAGFVIAVFTARQAGLWHSKTPVQAYYSYYQEKQAPWSRLKNVDPEKLRRMMEAMERMQGMEKKPSADRQ